MAELPPIHASLEALEEHVAELQAVRTELADRTA